MCGFIGRNGEPSAGPESTLFRARPFLDRRGPDSTKLWRSPDRRTEILHARLAIVDSGGSAHQPLSDPQTGTTVAFNGEIYNYPELRIELQDYPFRTISDTEVLLAAYRRWGIECLAHLRGTFAVAISDVVQARTYLARDPIGKKPLFLGQWRCTTFFGSSALALVAASGEQVAIDPVAASQYWEDGHVSPDRSIFVECRPVIPGEVVELRHNGPPRSFRIAPPTVNESDRTRATVQERLGELLHASITRRLRDNPDPAVLLSGGIDSTVVSRAVREHGSAQALTLGALVPWTLDEKYARYAARRIGLPLTVVRARIGRIEDEADFCFGLQDEPLGIMSFLPLSLLLREMKEHGRILLSGDGGDEVFLGYSRPSEWRSQAFQQPVVSNGSFPCGPPLPSWMSPWGRKVVTHGLVGHMFTKLDRASAEQGIEVRCPLLDWDLMRFARSVEPEVLCAGDRPKGLLKNELGDWPGWFVERPKMGFTWRLRWAWALRRFAGLRERIDRGALEQFRTKLSQPLRKPPASWRATEIFREFPSVWKLLAWAAFTRRLGAVGNVRRAEAVIVMGSDQNGRVADLVTQ